MKTLFVYYKLSLTEHTTWLPKVQAFQSELRRAWPALQTELMQRPEPNAQGLETWMSIASPVSMVNSTCCRSARMVSPAAVAKRKTLPTGSEGIVFMHFRVKAMTAAGQVSSLALDARDAAEAEQFARKQGYAVLSVAPAGIAASTRTR